MCGMQRKPANLQYPTTELTVDIIRPEHAITACIEWTKKLREASRPLRNGLKVLSMGRHRSLFCGVSTGAHHVCFPLHAYEVCRCKDGVADRTI